MILQVAGTIVQQPLAPLFNSHWHESLAWLINSHWNDSSLVAGTIVEQSLAPLFNSHWHDCSTVTGRIVQQLPARLINSHWHDYSTVVEESCHVPGIRHTIQGNDTKVISAFVPLTFRYLLGLLSTKLEHKSDTNTIWLHLVWKY